LAAALRPVDHCTCVLLLSNHMQNKYSNKHKQCPASLPPAQAQHLCSAADRQQEQHIDIDNLVLYCELCKAVGTGAWPATKQVVRLPGDYLSPAAALWVRAHMWAWLSPNSYHVLQCLAASVPVMAGYAQTKKAAATGRLAAGLPPPL